MKTGVIVFLLSLMSTVLAQDIDRDTLSYRHEIGLNQANFIILVDKDENTYDLNYKYHFKNKALRSAINFDYLNSNNTGKFDLELYLGLEWKKPYDKWQFFYGADVSYERVSYVESKRFANTYGFNPMIGLKYFIRDRFAITVNPKLNFFYSNFRDPESFIEGQNFDEFKIQIGGIGNFILSYHL